MKIGGKGVVILTAILLTGAVVWSLLPSPVPVEVAGVEARTLTVVIEEQGRTRARDPFIVAAPINGRLLRPTLEIGDQITQGQEIARIAVAPDDRRTEAMAQANLAAAQARRAAAEAELLEAESAYARARNEEERRGELFKTNVASAEEVEYYKQVTDASEAKQLSMRAALQAADAEVDSAQSLLLGSMPANENSILAVSAPVTGTVYQVYEESERVVQAGTPLYAISGENALEVIVDLLTQDAVQVSVGQPLLASGWGGDEVLLGEVTRIEPQAFTRVSALGVEEQRVNVIGSLQKVPANLGAEYRIDAGIVVWQQENVLTVPTSAIFQRQGRWHTFVVSAGRARSRAIGIGRRNAEYAQVLEGLAAGEQVIQFPSDLIGEGVAVEPAR